MNPSKVLQKHWEVLGLFVYGFLALVTLQAINTHSYIDQLAVYDIRQFARLAGQGNVLGIMEDTNVKFFLMGSSGELAGQENNAQVSPQKGLKGILVKRGTGKVRFEAVGAGSGVGFEPGGSQNNDTVFYLFKGQGLGEAFNNRMGYITFTLKSKYSLDERKALPDYYKYRTAFELHDGSKEILKFYVDPAYFTVGINGNTSINYREDSVQKYESLFGKNKEMDVKIEWQDNTCSLFLAGNKVGSQTCEFRPTWSNNSVLSIGAGMPTSYGGGWFASDDLISNFVIAQKNPVSSGGENGTLPTVAGLLGYWNFDEAEGTLVRDSSGQKIHGALVNSPERVAGKVGAGAIRFDGQNDYVKVSDFSINPNDPISINFWVKAEDKETRSPFNIGQKQDYAVAALLPFSNDKVWWSFTSPNEIYANVPDPGVWYNLTLISGGKHSKLNAIYVNGQKAAFVENSSAPKEPIVKGLEIGRWIGWYQFYFKGVIDEFRIYNKILSTEEIQALVSKSIGNPTPDSPIVQPPVASLTADKTVINSGQSVNLSWTTSNATLVSLDQNIGNVALSGTKTVSPTVTTTYKLTAKNANGQVVTSQVIVRVNSQPDLPPAPAPTPTPTPILPASSNAIRIKDLSGAGVSNRTFLISRVFKQGEIANFPQAEINNTAILTQVNVKSRWSDGSVKQTFVAFNADVSAGAWQTVKFVNQTTCNCDSGLNASQMLSSEYNFDATMTLNPGGVVDAKSMLQAGDFRYWIKGPLVTQVIIEDRGQNLPYDLSFNGHKTFHPMFVATFYPKEKKVKTEFIGENIWANARQDISYNLSLQLGGTPVYTKDNFNHSAQLRWRKTFWLNGEFSPVQIDYNLAYLTETKAIPNYDSSIQMTADAINTWANKRPTSECNSVTWSEAISQGKTDIGGPAQVCTYMPASGGRPDIGYIPGWYMAYLYSMGSDDVNAPKLYDIMIGNAEASGSIRMHFRENLTDRKYIKSSGENAFGHFLSISARPGMVLKPAQTQSDATSGDNLISVGELKNATGITPEVAHWPGLSYLPYLITGDYYFLEELWASSAYVIGDTAEMDAYRVRNKNIAGIISNTEFRGQAWALREVAQAAFISPDDSVEKAYYTKIFENNMAVREGMGNITNGSFYNPNCSTNPFDRTLELNPWCYGKNIQALYSIKNEYMQDNPLNMLEPGEAFRGDDYTVGYDQTKASASAAMWMWSYHWVTLGHAVDMGLPAKGYLHNRFKFLINLLASPDSVPQLAGAYTIPTRNGQNKMFRNIKEFVEAYEPAKLTEIINNNYGNAANPQHGFPIVLRAAASYLPGLTIDGLSGNTAWDTLNTGVSKYLNALAYDQTWAIVPRNSNLPTSNNNQMSAQGDTVRHPYGTDIIYKGVIYWISNVPNRMPYPNLSVYNSWHTPNDFSQVVPANAEDLKLPIGPKVPMKP